jgi:transmembrane sensor
VEQRDQSVTLERGDVGVVRPAGIEAGRGAAQADDIAWMQGRLVFRDAPLSRVASDLRRWYGVELRVADTALLQRHFTGSFVNESGDRVVDIIALALGARVQRHGDTAFIGGIAAPR